MAEMIWAVFEDWDTAEAVVGKLLDDGLETEQVGVVTRGTAGDYVRYIPQGIAGSAYFAERLVKREEVEGPGRKELEQVLLQYGVPSSRVNDLVQVVQKGAKMVVAWPSAEHQDQVRQTLRSFQPEDPHELVEKEQKQVSAYSAHPLAEKAFADYGGYEFDQGFSAFDDSYRGHYAINLASTGRPYAAYLPGYAYGYRLAIDEDFRHKDWGEIEAEARSRWEAGGEEAPWDGIRPAVHFAFDEVKEFLDEE